MPHLYKKKTNGRTYWYLREVHRVRGKVRLKWQKYLGTPESILARLQELERGEKALRLNTASFGALFVANELEKQLDTIGIVDRIVPEAANEKGPTVGEYFFYAWANRMIAPRSKRALEKWYKKTAIQHIRGVDVNALSSQRFWDKWDRVSEQQVEQIGKAFFEALWAQRHSSPESLLFDTTNYFTYMSTKTESALAQRGKNKSGKDHLRQIGVGLLLDGASSLPLYYKLYPGNLHDSKLLHQTLEEIFGLIVGFTDQDKQITVVFDKGMNSGENIAMIDAKPQVHFITTYSTYFADYLARHDLADFTPLDIAKNHVLTAKGKIQELLRAYRAELMLWGHTRTVIVTFNPVTFRKKLVEFTKKMDRIRTELLGYRRRYHLREPHWRSPKKIRSRYLRLCESLYISPRYYRLSFKANQMSLRKDAKEVAHAKAMMGKNIIVTDNHHWSTEQIVQSAIDRYRIESQFRLSKSNAHVQVNPMFHWTDSKIRCHLLSCVIALAALRLLELKVDQGLTAKTIMEEMQHLNSVLAWPKGAKKPHFYIEEPNQIQAKVLSAFGYQVKDGSVLHN